MRRTLLALMLAILLVAGWGSRAKAQEFPPPARSVEAAPRLPPPPPFGLDWAAPLGTPPFSRDAQTRERQAVSRQRAVLDWTRWQSNAWHLYGPEELWLFGPPLTFAWDLPPVEQPIGVRRTYDGRGGYSSGPIYADEVMPRPRLVPAAPSAMVAPGPAAEPVLGARKSLPAADRVPPTRTAEAPCRLFSW